MALVDSSAASRRDMRARSSASLDWAPVFAFAEAVESKSPSGPAAPPVLSALRVPRPTARPLSGASFNGAPPFRSFALSCACVRLRLVAGAIGGVEWIAATLRGRAGSRNGGASWNGNSTRIATGGHHRWRPRRVHGTHLIDPSSKEVAKEDHGVLRRSNQDLSRATT